MTKAERDALTSLVRQRFKLLRQDIAARKAEMIADLDRRLNDQFGQAEKAWSDSLFLIEQARDECNRKANDVYRQVAKSVGGEYPDTADYSLVTIHEVKNPIPGRKAAARRQALADIDAVESRAHHELARTENDLLTDLLTRGLETAEAREFINRVPTASALMVPTSALAALVGPLDDEGTDRDA
jgi:hypothetical protein